MTVNEWNVMFGGMLPSWVISRGEVPVRCTRLSRTRTAPTSQTSPDRPGCVILVAAHPHTSANERRKEAVEALPEPIVGLHPSSRTDAMAAAVAGTANRTPLASGHSQLNVSGTYHPQNPRTAGSWAA